MLDYIYLHDMIGILIERDSLWLDLIPSFQYSTWLKMQDIFHPNSLSLQLLKRNGTSYGYMVNCGISTPTYHLAKSLNCLRDQEHSQRGFGPRICWSNSMKTSHVVHIREFWVRNSFLSTATSSHFLFFLLHKNTFYLNAKRRTYCARIV